MGSTLSAANSGRAPAMASAAKTMPTEVSLKTFNYFFFFFIGSGTLLSGRKTGLSDGQLSNNSG